LTRILDILESSPSTLGDYMTNTSGFVDFLSSTDRLSLPALRFALRSVVAGNAYGDHFLEDDDKFLRLVGSALFWHEPMLDVFWARFEKILNLPDGPRDAPSLCKLLLSNESALWDVYQSEIVKAWKHQPEVVKRAFSETLDLLQTPALCLQGRHANVDHISGIYLLWPPGRPC
jgi:hypothetical protein